MQGRLCVTDFFARYETSYNLRSSGLNLEQKSTHSLQIRNLFSMLLQGFENNCPL